MLTTAPRRRLLLRAAAAAGAAALSGCAAWAPPMTLALRRSPPAGLPRRADLPEVPFFDQDDTLCGLAVLASLLAAAGRPRTLAELTPQVYLPGRHGTLQAEMLSGARRQGALAVELPPQLADLLGEIAAGTPVAVLLNLGLSFWPRWHYAVLVGYDLDTDTVRLHSGHSARAEWGLTPFEHTWARSGHWAFVALPPGQWPRSVSEASALRALFGLDRGGASPAERVRAWSSGARRWPGRLDLAIGLAAAQGEAGDREGAARTLEDAARQHDSAAAWNNLAGVRQQLGDVAGAQDAARRAVARAQAAEPRWLPAARQTLDELSR